MRYAIIADIHANLTALTAVLAEIESQGGVNELWCLGDTVGYGPDPHQCLELLRRYHHTGVAGNHDWAATSKVRQDTFNADATAACRWTTQQLSPEDKTYLESQPLIATKGDFTLVHGSPREPLWEYILSTGEARTSFDHFPTRYCLVGHSHIPLVFVQADTGVTYRSMPPGTTFKLDGRLIINPGSVGQPRGGDPRASYAIYDDGTNTLSIHRVDYDTAVTQSRMLKAGLPPRLAMRLSYGR